MTMLLMSLFACEHGMTLPSSKEITQKGPLRPNMKVEPRPRRQVPLLPIYDSSPPPPEYAVTAEQCDDLEDGGLVNGPDCATATIACGETIIGHTLGGVHKYDTRFYEKNFCTPATTNHEGGNERVYKFEMPPGDHKAFVTLDTPCADLDVGAIRFKDDRCPEAGSSVIPQCEMFPESGTTRERIEMVSQKGSTWWIVVEGKGDQNGLFALHVQCRAGLI